MDTTLIPTFLRELLDPSVRTVLFVGCGGGFDFVHSALLMPELRKAGKRIVVVSNSFGNPRSFSDAEVVLRQDELLAVRVTAKVRHSSSYAPESHLVRFLDHRYPDDAPHSLIACNARSTTPRTLTALLQHVVDKEGVDALVAIDGGSDSLMRGDEWGLGDPVEDAVTVSAVARVTGPRVSLLLTVGFGTDRFNNVSDASSLRAVAELSAAGGFLGSVSLEPGSMGVAFYRECLKAINEGHGEHGFRSVLSGCIAASCQGMFGDKTVPPDCESRVRPGSVYLWPLMAMLWAFRPQAVVQRSLTCAAIADARAVPDMYEAFEVMRSKMEKEGTLLPVEDLPTHAKFCPSATSRT